MPEPTEAEPSAEELEEEYIYDYWSEFTFILRQSPISGLGVFATHDIPANSVVFLGKLAIRQMKICDIPEEFLMYCIYISDEECLCPARFDRMEIAWFLNHSDEPNIAVEFGSPAVTLRDIVAGEEVLMDYNAFGEPDHLKDEFYRHAESFADDEDEELEHEEGAEPEKEDVSTELNREGKSNHVE